MSKNKNKSYNEEIIENIDILASELINKENSFFNKIFAYIYKFENEYYQNMDIIVREKVLIYKIEILEELIEYIENHHIANKPEILENLNNIKKNNKLDLNDKEFIINQIENKPIASEFLNYIKDKYNILPELEMLYERYSSILHLIIISMTINKYYEIEFSYESNNIELKNDNKIKIYCTNNEIIKSDSIWLKQLILRYCYFNYILNTSKTPKVLSIFLVDFPKILYNTNIIGPAEINTGMTNGVYINITRKDEALKTLLHELIHFHNMDFREIPEKLNNLLHNKFKNTDDEGINMKLNLFEAYTEFVASIINICLFYDYNVFEDIKKNFTLYKNNFTKRLYEQVIYTFGKCYSIYDFYNCITNKNVNINNININNINKTCEIRQKTNLVSYFFIKSYLYLYINTFIDCIYIDNMKFIENYKSFNKLYKIIKKCSSSNELYSLYKACYITNTTNSNSINMVCITENIF